MYYAGGINYGLLLTFCILLSDILAMDASVFVLVSYRSWNFREDPAVRSRDRTNEYHFGH